MDWRQWHRIPVAGVFCVLLLFIVAVPCTGAVEQTVANDSLQSPPEEVATIEPAFADRTGEKQQILLGFQLLEQNDIDRAQAVFDQILILNPRSFPARTGRGAVLARRGKLSEAEQLLKGALVYNPDPVRTLYELGRVYEQLGDDTQAAATYKKGLEKYRQGRK